MTTQTTVSQQGTTLMQHVTNCALAYPLTYRPAYQTDYIGLSRSDCAQRFAAQVLPTVLFATWMMVPKLNLVLTFRHQRCVAVEVLGAIAAIDPKYHHDYIKPTHQHNPGTCHYGRRG